MLVLTRKKGERIVLGGQIRLTVLECQNGRVRLGFEAPTEVDILREEIGESKRATPRPAPGGKRNSDERTQ